MEKLEWNPINKKLNGLRTIEKLKIIHPTLTVIEMHKMK